MPSKRHSTIQRNQWMRSMHGHSFEIIALLDAHTTVWSASSDSSIIIWDAVVCLPGVQMKTYPSTPFVFSQCLGSHKVAPFQTLDAMRRLSLSGGVQVSSLQLAAHTLHHSVWVLDQSGMVC